MNYLTGFGRERRVVPQNRQASLAHVAQFLGMAEAKNSNKTAGMPRLTPIGTIGTDIAVRV
jgi:hypothetical protein